MYTFIFVSELKKTPFTFVYGKETAAIIETTRIFQKMVCNFTNVPLMIGFISQVPQKLGIR